MKVFFSLVLLLFLPLTVQADAYGRYNKYMRDRGLVTFSTYTTGNPKARIEEVVFSDDYATPDPSYTHQHLALISWWPTQPAKKFLNKIKIGQTTQFQVIELLSGPNLITLEYPSEREMWVYFWKWSYDLRYPIEDSLIKMDHPGRRILRGKNPVEMEVVFNKEDIVEDVRMKLIKRGPEY